MEMGQGSNSVAYLKAIYEKLSGANAQYSQRAFARKLGLSAGGLSQIFTGKKKLSVARAMEIAESLRLAAEEREYFVMLVQLESARSGAVRSELYERLKLRHPERAAETQNLSLDQFRVISDWYGFAILQLVSAYGAKWSTSKIAKHLGLKKIEAEMTLARLRKLELIEGDSEAEGYRRVSDRVVVDAAAPNEAARNYYRGIFAKAEASIEAQAPNEKVIGTEVFAFDPSALPEVKRLTDQYLDRLLTLAKSGERRTEMYQVIVNCFRISERNSP